MIIVQTFQLNESNYHHAKYPILPRKQYRELTNVAHQLLPVSYVFLLKCKSRLCHTSHFRKMEYVFISYSQLLYTKEKNYINKIAP